MTSLTRLSLGRLVPIVTGGSSPGLIDVELSENVEVLIQKQAMGIQVADRIGTTVWETAISVALLQDLRVDLDSIEVEIGICNG